MQSIKWLSFKIKILKKTPLKNKEDQELGVPSFIEKENIKCIGRQCYLSVHVNDTFRVNFYYSTTFGQIHTAIHSHPLSIFLIKCMT